MINQQTLVAYLALLISNIVGSLSLLLFGLFLFGYSFSAIETGFENTGILAWNALLCLMFFIQHSGMIRKAYRQWQSRIIPADYHGALYTIASGVVLICLVIFWQSSGLMLISLDGVSRWLAHGLFFASLLGMLWGMRALHGFDTFGNRQLLARIHALQEPAASLSVKGPYRWVRHPLYFFVLVMIWSCPDLSLDRLLFNMLFTIWIVVGTLLEERDLVAEFGESYRNYQHQVPMLIPWKLARPRVTNND